MIRSFTWMYYLACASVLAVGLQVGLAAGPIDVGSRKQLFIDHKFIAAGRGVKLTMNPPVKTNQPVLADWIPWEGEPGAASGSYASVMKEGNLIRIWGAGKKILPASYTEGGPVVSLFSYAESRDGIHFVKPDPGLIAYDAGKAEMGKYGRPVGYSVWIDPKAPPNQRYKTQGKNSGALCIYASPDGYRWTFFDLQVIGKCDTQSNIFWDEPLQKYLLYTRAAPYATKAEKNRAVRRLESTDVKNWTNEVIVMKTDEVDLATYDTPTLRPPLDYYSAAVFRYPDGSADSPFIMLADTYWHWKEYPPEIRNMGKGEAGNELAPAAIDVRLSVSRDGVSFERLGGRKPFIGVGLEGTWNSKWVWALPNPIRMGDELWIYYFGKNIDHNRIDDPAACKPMSGIDRAILRLDGFVSADVDYTGGEIVTPLIKFSGKRLELNFDGGAGGSVRVELLDEHDKPIEGYSGPAAEALYGNSVRLPVRWGDNQDVSPLAGKPIKMRLTMRDCKLYAFQFVQ